jgi:hypothetical protein
MAMPNKVLFFTYFVKCVASVQKDETSSGPRSLMKIGEVR